MQKRVAIIYGTTEGQTERITNFIAENLRTVGGEDVAVMHVGEVPLDYALDNSDAVVIGASIHVREHQPGVIDYVRDHAEALNAMPSAFFSVSLSGHNNEEEAQKYIAEFQEKTGWNPDITASFAGALAYREYNFIKRRLMRSIAEKGGLDTDISKNHEYTDWDDVRAFAEAFENLIDG
jgi:menaquinone-dependent protoporphyrinogen oxidase